MSPRFRRRGHGQALFAAIEGGSVWPAPPVGIALGVAPRNADARRLYERCGFIAAGTTMVRKAPVNRLVGGQELRRSCLLPRVEPMVSLHQPSEESP